MGNDRTSTSQSQQAQATPEERALEQQQINLNNFMMPYTQKNYAALSDNINAILNGQTPMAKGINGVTDDQVNNMVASGLRQLYPQFQSSGIMDSGEAIGAATNAAANIANQNAQFNVSAAQNLFNLAAGGQSNLQSQYQANTNSLSSSLAGLRSYSGTSTTTSMNPFLKSFQTSLGTSLGKVGQNSMGDFGFGYGG